MPTAVHTYIPYLVNNREQAAGQSDRREYAKFSALILISSLANLLKVQTVKFYIVQSDHEGVDRSILHKQHPHSE
jgi:hypothetical protein